MLALRRDVLLTAAGGVLVDMAMCVAAILFADATLVHRAVHPHYPLPETTVVFLAAAEFALATALIYAFAGLYRPQLLSRTERWVRTVVAWLAASVITGLAIRLVADRVYVEQLMPAAVGYLGALFLATRAFRYLVHRVAPRPRVLIVGAGDEARSVAEEVARGGPRARQVIGFLATGTQGEAGEGPIGKLPVFGGSTSVMELVRRHRIDEIIVAVKEQRGGGVPIDQLLDCRVRGVQVLDLAGFTERNHGEIRVDCLKGSWLVYGEGFIQGPVRRAVKRTFDLIGSTLLLLLALPIMAATALLIVLESPGGVLYRQIRVGEGGRHFRCTKFRSMRSDAEADGVERWAQQGDPRITRVGAFIRKTRIDELPQLWNVLCGEMSLVGPRPERPGFVEQLKQAVPFYDLRHSVKPGITGWAQVRYHYGGSVEDAKRKQQFDLYYVKNNNLKLDLQILIETVSVVLFREGL